MSDTMAAILVLPMLATLVVVLECARIGCTTCFQRWRDSRNKEANQPVGGF